jgi:peptidyl-prolyl cis-trans isomerase A (cyclophilin A)
MTHLLLCLLLACQDSTTKEEPTATTTPAAKNTDIKAAPQKKEEVKEAPQKKEEGIERQALDLDPKKAIKKAPDQYEVMFETTKGNVVIEIKREWAPLGADRFYNLVDMGYFTDVAFFRAIKGFMTQFGIHGDPNVSKVWRTARIKDDTVTQSNKRGYLSFATSGPNSRTTQLFINTKDNGNLDAMGFSPFGSISESKGGGMKVVDSLYMGYGEGAPRGKGPNQMLIQKKGNAYLKESFSELDYIKSARICADDCTK